MPANCSGLIAMLVRALLVLLRLLSSIAVVNSSEEEEILTSVKVREGPASIGGLEVGFRLPIRPLLQNRLSLEDYSHVTRIHFYKEDQAYPFGIDQPEAIILLREALDREKVCRPGKLQSAVECGSALDAPDMCCLRLRLSVQVGPLVRAFYVRVIVEDVNDSAPSFENSIDQRYHSVSEKAPIGYEIELPTATDPDSEENGIAEYQLRELRPGNGSLEWFFQLLGNRPPLLAPKLRLRQQLDYEQMPEFAFILSAVDKGNPKLTGTMTYVIEVKDVNDCTPEIVDFQPGLLLSVNETDGRFGEHVIADFSVLDADSGENGRVQCYIKSLPGVNPKLKPSRFFKVQQKGRQSAQKKTTWELSANAQLDYEQVKSFSFLIVARDHGSTRLSSSVSVSVVLLNVDDHKMEISFWRHGKQKERVEVTENLPAGLEVATVEVKDLDYESTEQYRRIVCELELDRLWSVDVQAAFRLEEKLKFDRVKEFHLRTAATFDRERRNEYTVRVACRDTESEARGFAQLRVIVTDQNDCLPEFSRLVYRGKVEENSPRNSQVAMESGMKIHAADRDAFPNNRVVYRLNGSDSGAFAINQLGELTVDGDIDFERKAIYQFNVTAENDNNANMSSTAKVIVEVVDLNDNAPVISKYDQGYHFTVREETSPVKIGQINATDADYLPENRIIYFRILPSTPSESRAQGLSTDAQKYFHIESPTGVLKAIAPIDRETRTIFNFQVLAENQKRLQPEPLIVAGEHITSSPSITTVQVVVLNINDHPPHLCQRHSHQPSGCSEPQLPIRVKFDADSSTPVFIDQPVTPTDQRCVQFDYRIRDPDEPYESAGGYVVSLTNVTDMTSAVAGGTRSAPLVSGVEFALSGEQSHLFCVRRLPASSRDSQLFGVILVLTEETDASMQRAYEVRVTVLRVRRPAQPLSGSSGGDVNGFNSAVGGGFVSGTSGGVGGGGGSGGSRHNTNQFAESSGERRQFVIIVTLITVLVFIVVIVFAFVLFFYVKRMDRALHRECDEPDVPVELQEQACKLLVQQHGDAAQRRLSQDLHAEPSHDSSPLQASVDSASHHLQEDSRDRRYEVWRERASQMPLATGSLVVHHQPHSQQANRQVLVRQLPSRLQTPLTGPLSRRMQGRHLARSANSCEDVSPMVGHQAAPVIGYQVIDRPNRPANHSGYQTLHAAGAASSGGTALSHPSCSETSDSAPYSPKRTLKCTYLETSFV